MSHIRKLLHFVKPYWRRSLVSLVFLVAVTFMDLTLPRLIQRIIDQGGFPKPGKPAEFANFIDSEVKVWGDIIRTANVTLPD